MSVNNPSSAQNQNLYIGGVPKEGSQSLLINFDLNNNAKMVDLTMDYQTGRLSGVQAVYIDAKDSDKSILLTCVDTGQVIQVKPHSQGYYPLLSGNYLKFKCASEYVGIIPIFFLNFAIAAASWSSA